MKLCLCIQCNEVFSLSHDYHECKGGHCGGQYIDHLNAKVWGDPTKMFVLGFANSSVVHALKKQINDGDLPPTMYYGGKMTPPGREFDAFIIPNAADSIERVLEKFPAIVVKPEDI